MDGSGVPPRAYLYTLGNGNVQQSPSTAAGGIPVSPNDEVSNTAVHGYGAMTSISQAIQGPSTPLPPTSFVLPSARIQNNILLLVQNPYRSGLQVNSPRTVPPIYYAGFNLHDASVEDFRGLQDSDQLAWADNIPLPPKLTIVFCFPGYPMYRRQVTLLRAHNRPPTRGNLAYKVAREMRKFLDKARTEYGRPLRLHGWELNLSDLFLIDIQQVSRGSLQPRIGILGNI